MQTLSRDAMSPISFGDELASSVIHGIGIVLSIAGLAILEALAARHGDARVMAASAVYGATLVLLHIASTLYHSISVASAKPALRTLDHIAIFLLIAGTYTPFTLIALPGGWGRTCLAQFGRWRCLAARWSWGC